MSRIITVPHPVLRQVAKPVVLSAAEGLDKKTLNVIRDMEKVLKAATNPQGVGLAAPQIGVSLRIFMIRPKVGGPITTFINPEIISYSQRQTKPTSKNGVYEGCLSIPLHYAPVTRSTSITIRYLTLPSPEIRRGVGGEVIEKTDVFSAFPAHIIQHEMDHLNGILFIDHVLSQNSKLFKLTGKDKWEEVGL